METRRMLRLGWEKLHAVNLLSSGGRVERVTFYSCVSFCLKRVVDVLTRQGRSWLARAAGTRSHFELSSLHRGLTAAQWSLQAH